MNGLVKKARGLPRFMLDCGFWRTLKWSGASLAAIGLQTCAISYCTEHGTNGLLPADVVGLAVALGVREKDVARTLPEMLRRGAWAKGDDRYEIVGYLDHNPSRQEVDSYRERRAKAGQKANHERWHGDRVDESCPLCATEQRPPPEQLNGSESDSDSDPPRDHTSDSQSRVEDAEQSPPTPPTSSDGIQPGPPPEPAAGGPSAGNGSVVIVDEALRLLAGEAVDADPNPPRNRDACIRKRLGDMRLVFGRRLTGLATDVLGLGSGAELIAEMRRRDRVEADTEAARNHGETLARGDSDWSAIEDTLTGRYPVVAIREEALAAARSVYEHRMPA